MNGPYPSNPCHTKEALYTWSVTVKTSPLLNSGCMVGHKIIKIVRTSLKVHLDTRSFPLGILSKLFSDRLCGCVDPQWCTVRT